MYELRKDRLPVVLLIGRIFQFAEHRQSVWFSTVVGPQAANLAGRVGRNLYKPNWALCVLCWRQCDIQISSVLIELGAVCEWALLCWRQCDIQISSVLIELGAACDWALLCWWQCDIQISSVLIELGAVCDWALLRWWQYDILISSVLIELGAVCDWALLCWRQCDIQTFRSLMSWLS